MFFFSFFENNIENDSICEKLYNIIDKIMAMNKINKEDLLNINHAVELLCKMWFVVSNEDIEKDKFKTYPAWRTILDKDLIKLSNHKSNYVPKNTLLEGTHIDLNGKKHNYLSNNEYFANISELLSAIKENVLLKTKDTTDKKRREKLSNKIYFLCDKILNLGTDLNIDKKIVKENVKIKNKSNEPYVFISYSHEDSHYVLPMIEELQKRYNVWYDDGIAPATEWDEDIAKHVEECDFFIACMTKNYIESSNCKDELNYARDLNKKRLIVYFEIVELPSGMKMRLNRLQNIHKYVYDKEEDFYDKLYKSQGIESCIKTPINNVKQASLDIFIDFLGSDDEIKELHAKIRKDLEKMSLSVEYGWEYRMDAHCDPYYQAEIIDDEINAFKGAKICVLGVFNQHELFGSRFLEKMRLLNTKEQKSILLLFNGVTLEKELARFMTPKPIENVRKQFNVIKELNQEDTNEILSVIYKMLLSIGVQVTPINDIVKNDL